MNLINHLQHSFLRLHPKEASRNLQFMPPVQAAELLSPLEPDEIGEVLENLLPQQAKEILIALPPELGATILTILPQGLARAIFRLCDSDTRTGLLFHLNSQNRSFLLRSVRSSGMTAGSLADPNVLTLSPVTSVSEALTRISSEKRHVINYLYVLGQDSKLCGVVILKELQGMAPDTPIQDLMTSQVSALPADSYAQDIFSHPSWKLFDTLPVVEQGNFFLGALRFRTLRKALEFTGDAPQGGYLSDALLQLWEAYSLSGIELMTTVGGVLQPGAPSQPEFPRTKDTL